MSRQPVTVPVEAKIGPIQIGLFEQREVVTHPGSHLVEPTVQVYPLAWCARVVLTFFFVSPARPGRPLQTSKTIKTRFSWPVDPPRSPSPSALAAGKETALHILRNRVADHGLVVPIDHPIEEFTP